MSITTASFRALVSAVNRRRAVTPGGANASMTIGSFGHPRLLSVGLDVSMSDREETDQAEDDSREH